jgi:hypothetical protein
MLIENYRFVRINKILIKELKVNKFTTHLVGA